jgi:hypothetical protein
MKDIQVLVGCERSGIVRDAFAKRGFDAWSCDTEPQRTPGNHLQCDVREIWHDFDLIILHPPCTHIAVSGARHFPEKIADGRQGGAIRFFMDCINAPCQYVAVENPICIMSTIYRKPDQIIQPWEYGHGETKATCLWLKNLPKLIPTNIVEGREQRIWKLPPTNNRSEIRSQTFQGIADAMAQQWGDFILKPKGTMFYFGIQQKLFQE